MARLALSVAGLALAAARTPAHAGSSLAALDSAALLQVQNQGNVKALLRKASMEPMDMESSLSSDRAGYAFENFPVGTLVEGKTSDGQWVLCVIERLRPDNVWDVTVADRLPGHKLPLVPARLLRKRLGEGESDWHVDNPGRMHSGEGLIYRRSKDLMNVSKAYAPWDSLVVGRDEGDGWLKTSGGYLPMTYNGARVLSQRYRVAPVPLSREFKDWYVQKEADRRQAALSEEIKKPPPPQKYSAHEMVNIMGTDGKWHPAQILSRGLFANTYNVITSPIGGKRYPALSVPSSLLRKVGPPEHIATPGENPLCQKQGCVRLRLQSESGEEYKVHAPLKLPVESLVKMACRKIYVPWERCQTRLTLHHGGRMLSPAWRTYEASLKDDDVVTMKLAPVTATPIRDMAA